VWQREWRRVIGRGGGGRAIEQRKSHHGEEEDGWAVTRSEEDGR
jgi:hypothetical protein